MTTRIVTIKYECKAPSKVFGEWEDIGEDLRAKIDESNGLNCDAGGIPGTWCVGCHWYTRPVIEDDDLV